MLGNQNIIMYTDGACKGNPGKGGWAAIIINVAENNNKTTLVGSDKNTTNNRMEVTAVLNGLKSLKTSSNVIIYSDSTYVVNAFSAGWLDAWEDRDFKLIHNASKDMKNSDLWRELNLLRKQHNLQFVWIKGHAGNEFNEQCDKLAQRAAGLA